MKTLLFILAPENFRDIEYIVPKAFCEQNNIAVTTTSSEKISTGRFGYTVEHKKTLENSSAENFDGIVFVGGGGSLDFMENENAKNLAHDFAQQNKVVSAICAAPRLLISWGILQGKKCTGWNGDNQVPVLCEQFDALFEDKEVVVDGNFVTGNGPEAAEKFILAVIKTLK